jgi:surface antigen
MGRSHDFYSQILYHGSSTLIPVGELVLSTQYPPAIAYATTDKSLARGYAGPKGHVHTVEPLKDDATLTSEKKGTVAVSRRGFRVTGTTT